MNILKTQVTKTVKLIPPCKPTKENIFGFNVGMRPFRKGGIRLDKQQIKDKVFYHNYGHGSAGVTLAPSTSKRIVNLFSKDLGKDVKNVAVIGSGYMGLMEANILADQGYKVAIYAKTFPKEAKLGDNHMNIASSVAGGYWMPYGLDITDKKYHFDLALESFEIYNNYINSKKYQSIGFKDMYIINSANPSIEYCPPGLIETDHVKVDFGNGVFHDAAHFRTILIDGDIFLRELREEAEKKGVKFESRDFKDVSEICSLKEDVIFNCTGVFSKILFNDQNVVPIVGHQVYLKKVPGVDYFLSATNKDGKARVTMYPQAKKLAIGYSYEYRGMIDKVDPEVIKDIIRNYEQFLEERAGIK